MNEGSLKIGNSIEKRSGFKGQRWVRVIVKQGEMSCLGMQND